MNELEMKGFDGANPLHALGALGALVVTNALDAEHAALGWTIDEQRRYVARLRTSLDAETWAARASAWITDAASIRSGADPSVRRRVRDLGAAEKKAAKAVKEARKSAKNEARRQGLRGLEARAFEIEITKPLRRELARTSKEREQAQLALALELGFGYAHLGEIIGVPAVIYREHLAAAIERRDRPLIAHLVGLASDGCFGLDGKVVPSPYSFGNGASGQCLLKDWRKLVEAHDASMLREGSLEGRTRTVDMTSLNWDPGDLRSAAFTWSDPQAMAKETDVPANILAFLGLGLLTAVPSQAASRRGALEAVGFERGFTWPIWTPLLSRDEVAALLASPLVTVELLPAQRAARGILAVYRSDKVNPTGKRNYFAPARPL